MEAVDSKPEQKRKKRIFIEDEDDDLCDDKFGEVLLYYGCRNKDKDFLFADDISNLQTYYCVPSTLRTAFSRDSEEKVYVSHKLVEDGKKLINNGARKPRLLDFS